MRERLLAAVLSLSVSLSCGGTPPPRTPSPPALSPPPVDRSSERVDALQRHIEALVQDPSVSAGTWGVEVRSLRTNEPLAAVNASRLLTPASSLKLVTLAVAADQLGWDFSFETQVVSDGRIENGILSGDLVIVGSGDPSLDDWDGAATTVFKSWAATLKDAGVSAIAGRIVGDGRAFQDAGLGAGWAWDDLALSYSAPVGGLQFNQNSAQVIATPGPTPGATAHVTIRPPYAELALQVDVRTAAAGTRSSLLAQPVGRVPAAVLRGSVAVDAPPAARALAVANPSRYYATAVREGLRHSGIDVRGAAVDVADLADPPASVHGPVLMTHRSPTLDSLADTMMRFSQNLYAESLLRTLGRIRGTGGTADAGNAVVHDTLAAWGIPPSEVQLVDGSGLSRYNLITPRALAGALAHVYADPRLRDAYMAVLPLAGRTGTLVNRMKGTAAEGLVSAKTGSFLNARAIAGFVRTADDEPLAFAIVANNYGVGPAAVDRVSDAIIVSLAEFSREADARAATR
ncbi:MAG: D-alanyl-D-alanine carboxypeptidase/D-alanyl-D-alanine-endopeptidase [Vicinamibacterales bacterium]